MNPFKVCAERNPGAHRHIVLEAIAASVTHHGWAEFYAARRGAFKVAGEPLRGSFLDGHTFMAFLGLDDRADPEDSGGQGMELVRDAAHEFLAELTALTNNVEGR